MLSIKVSIIFVTIFFISSMIYFIFYNEEKPTIEKSFNVEILSAEEYADEQIRRIQSENPNLNEVLSKCGIDEHCVVENLQVLAGKENQDAVLTTFDGILSIYNDSNFYCHPQAHHLGMFLYGYLGDLEQSLLYADQRCGGSVYHGVVQNFLTTETLFGTNELDDIDITKICSKDLENPYSLERWQCLHGLGHALTELHNYDVASAVNNCEEFELRWEQLSCSKGIFMENIMEFSRSSSGAFDDEDLFFPCDKVEKKYAPACYHYHTHYIMIQKNQSVSDSFAECDGIIPQDFVRFCYYGMGREMTGYAFYNLELAINKCAEGNPKYQTYCLAGLLLTYVNNKGTDEGFELCTKIPEEAKSECYDGMGKWILMKYSSEEEREKECLKAENSEFSEICNNANLDDILLL